MNIETGVFTTVTSGYYIITFSAYAQVQAREYTRMYFNHNGGFMEESLFVTSMFVGDSKDIIEVPPPQPLHPGG